MTDVKISDLVAAGTVEDADIFPMVQSGDTKHATIAQMKAAVAPEYATESEAGIIEIANQTEAESGSNDDRAMTSLKTQQFVDKGIVSDSATGGNKGVGTINAKGLFVNGEAVAAGAADGWLSDTDNFIYYYNDFVGASPTSVNAAPFTAGTAAGVNVSVAFPNLVLESGSTSSGRTGFNMTGRYGLKVGKYSDAMLEICTTYNVPSSSTQRYITRLGFIGVNPTSDQAEQIMFRQVDNVNSEGWQCVCRSGSVETVINTSVTPSGEAIFKIVLSSGGTSAEFFINGVSQGSISTNVPTANLAAGIGIRKSVGTLNITYRLEYMKGKKLK